MSINAYQMASNVNIGVKKPIRSLLCHLSPPHGCPQHGMALIYNDTLLLFLFSEIYFIFLAYFSVYSKLFSNIHDYI